ncbi:MAG: phosphatidic acid phosphatase, partial [Flavobacteriaceae bacterium]|nr:phosphatidic acid phosphatase [Flavobacteriaceae bacterium]
MRLIANNRIGIFLLLFGIALLSSCSEKKPIAITADHFHQAVDKVTTIMVHDIFSPPVASRIYAYPNIAAYEMIAVQDSTYKNMAGVLRGLSPIPAPSNDGVNVQLAALIAHMDVSRTLIFSEDKMISYRDSLYGIWKNSNPEEFEASKEYGLQVSDHIQQWYDGDLYKQTRTMPKFTVDTD